MADGVAVFSGGGTGGHLYPAIALAEALARIAPGARPLFVGAERGIEARILPARGVEHLLLPVRGGDRGRALANLGVLRALAVSLLRVIEHFHRVRPQLVVVTGGYAGGPAGIAAALMGIPLALQEQNALPGVTTRLLSRWARQVHLAFPEAAAHLPRPGRARSRVSGNPVRPPLALSQAEARTRLGVPTGGPLVLAVGGSQGSEALNALLLEGIRRGGRGDAPFHLLWSTGPSQLEGVRRALGELGAPEWVHAVGYLEEMPVALAAADLAVSRAGAMATSEFLAQGLPSLLIPLPTAAADHQTRNAEALEAAGAAVHLPQRGLEADTLWSTLQALVSDPDRMRSMAREARARGRPAAAMEIALALRELLPGGTP